MELVKPSVAQSDLTVIQKISSKNDAIKSKSKNHNSTYQKKVTLIGTATFDIKNLVGTGYISDPPQKFL